MGGTAFASTSDLKEGRFLMIDGEPCRIVGMTKSKPGKHGEAKYRIDGIGVFDGRRRTLLCPSGEEVEIPIIDRKNAQIVAVVGTNLQLMDLASFEMFESPIPEELKGQPLEAGKEVEYVETMGRRMVTRLR